MVHIPVYARQVLQSRQRLVDGGVIDNLLDDTTTDTQSNNRVAGAAVAAAAGTTSTGTSTITNTNTSTKAAIQTTATDTLTTDTSSRVPPLPTVTTTTSSSSSTSLTTSSSSALPTTTSTSSTISTTSTPPPPQSTSTVPAGVQFVTVSSSPAAASPSTSLAPNGAAAGAPVPFLENTAAKAAVFSLAGLVGLGLLIFIISLIVRRVRQKRLVEDAVSFNPSDLLDHRSDIERVNSRSSIEKAPYYGSDSGHSNSGHSNYSRGGGVQPTYAATYDYNQPTYDYNQPSYDYNGQGYYASQQQQAYGGYNNNPVQLPSQNVGRATPPPPLLPSMNGTPQEAALRSGGSGYLGGPNPPGLQQQQQGSSIRRSPSGTGSIVDNPYLGPGGYKVANA